MAYTTDIWAAMTALEELIKNDNTLGAIPHLKRIPFHDILFSGDENITIYPVSATTEPRGVGTSSTIDTYTVDVGIKVPCRHDDDYETVEKYNKALKELINTYPTLNDTAGVVDVSVVSESFTFFPEQTITYVLNTIRLEVQII